MTGFIDTTANFPYEFNIPDIKLTSDIKIKYGNVILDSITVNLNLSGLLAKPAAIIFTTFGINISIIKVTIRRKYSNSEKIFLENFIIDFSSSFTI